MRLFLLVTDSPSTATAGIRAQNLTFSSKITNGHWCGYIPADKKRRPATIAELDGKWHTGVRCGRIASQFLARGRRGMQKETGRTHRLFTMGMWRDAPWSEADDYNEALLYKLFWC